MKTDISWTHVKHGSLIFPYSNCWSSTVHIYIYVDEFNNIYIYIQYMDVSSNGVPQNHGFQCSNGLILDDLGYPYFRKPPYCSYKYT